MKWGAFCLVHILSIVMAAAMILGLFYQVLPCEYWYMLLVLPVVAVYLCLVYMPQLVKLAKSRQSQQV